MFKTIYSGGVTNEILLCGYRPIIVDLAMSYVSKEHEPPSKTGLCQVGIALGFGFVKLGLINTYIDEEMMTLSIDIPDNIGKRLGCSNKGIDAILDGLEHIKGLYFSITSRTHQTQSGQVTYNKGKQMPIIKVGGIIIDIGIDCGSYYNKIY